MLLLRLIVIDGGDLMIEGFVVAGSRDGIEM
jgi:hypothetical protein